MLNSVTPDFEMPVLLTCCVAGMRIECFDMCVFGLLLLNSDTDLQGIIKTEQSLFATVINFVIIDMIHMSQVL